MTGGHTPRVEFDVGEGGVLEARPACTCGWVSDQAFDRDDPRGVDLALDSWSEAHDGWAQTVVLPEALRTPNRQAAIVSLSRRNPALPDGPITARKQIYTNPLAEAMFVRYVPHDDPAADETCPDPWPGEPRTADAE